MAKKFVDPDLNLLRLHEVKVLENEFFKEKLIRERLILAIETNRQNNMKSFVNFLNSPEGIKELEEMFKKLRAKGLTPEKAEQMTDKEFREFVKKNNIEIPKN